MDYIIEDELVIRIPPDFLEKATTEPSSPEAQTLERLKVQMKLMHEGLVEPFIFSPY
ncbi:hypothetical protein S140_84 [Shewanella sp. phage 1/40]|uniref:hypothetical protein n=1 Tax=Shewanella sp. phage 1/40 TaxID=1458860 RepID=UPI0004F6242D|nr:hypothetical protein S140_84 [Shewanella sp. phage 1/40]AHK11491.1 hypothetical protein S140_84 [Shewanella sp. phage 1/40]